MKYSLIKPINPNYNAIEQILTNRGIKQEDIEHYLNTTNADINSYEGFGKKVLHDAAATLITTINLGMDAILIVDSDCDGFTSAALIYNYLYEMFPDWTAAHLSYRIHDGKQHGLNDHIQNILQSLNGEHKLIIIPDAGSNDIQECQALWNEECLVIILDHHICDINNPYAFVINNQISDYPNKELSGVGVTWQFCRYLDDLLGTTTANKYLDLVALGNCADMMSMLSFETKHLIQIGLKEENLCNPFITYMIEKNRYSIGDKVTPIGVAFYVAPFVNAIVRSGTNDEKELIFKSMLSQFAFEKVPSTKRGHTAGAMESIVEQAIRVATNVKARQTKAQDNSMDLLERKIENENLLDHKVILFLLEPGQIDKNIAGLCANKIMAKYQRPCCILTKVEEVYESDPTTYGDCIKLDPPFDPPYSIKFISYQGSARGCDTVGITEFKDICEATQCIRYATGHQGAFGLGIDEDKIPEFIQKTDELLKDMPNEAIYHVDYIWEEKDVRPQAILDIANLDSLWGKDLPEALIAIQNLKVTPEMVTIYDKKGYTIKITLSDGIALMLFRATELDCAKLQYNNTGYIELNIVAKCNQNEWMGNITPQLFIEDYEVVDSKKYFF